MYEELIAQIDTEKLDTQIKNVNTGILGMFFDGYVNISKQAMESFRDRLVQLKSATTALTTLTAENARLTAELEKMKEANRWVPVSDAQKPDDGEYVMCLVGNGLRVETLKYRAHSKEFREYDEEHEEWWSREDVTAWRPLPTEQEA